MSQTRMGSAVAPAVALALALALALGLTASVLLLALFLPSPGQLSPLQLSPGNGSDRRSAFAGVEVATDPGGSGVLSGAVVVPKRGVVPASLGRVVTVTLVCPYYNAAGDLRGCVGRGR